MITLPTPATVAVGQRGGRLSFYYVEADKFHDMSYPIEGVDLAELSIQGSELRSHLVMASLSTSIVKAVAVDGDVDVLDAAGLRRMKRMKVTIQSVRNREVGKWEDAWNKLLIIGGGERALALGASRAGALFHINASLTDRRRIETALNVLLALKGFGETTLTCSCRLGPMPVEILSRHDNEYVLVKIYFNILSRKSEEVVVIRGIGGNILRRRIGPLDLINKYIEEVLA